MVFSSRDTKVLLNHCSIGGDKNMAELPSFSTQQLCRCFEIKKELVEEELRGGCSYLDLI